MSVKLMQKEITYEVEYKGKEYTVSLLIDNITEHYYQYDVYDDQGEYVEGELESEVVDYLEAHTE